MKAMPKYSEEDKNKAQEASIGKEISLSELNQRYSAALAQKNSYNNAIGAIETYKKQVDDINAKIAEILRNNAILEKTEDTKENIEELQSQINNAETINSEIRTAKTTIQKVEEYSKKKKEYNNLTQKIKELDEEKSKKLSEAQMPIEGLSYDEENVLYNTIPFNQLSGAEQLKISMAIAMAQNPKLRVVLIRDGSLLDAENLKIIKKMAKEQDYQVWCEKVDDSGKIGIYIE